MKRYRDQEVQYVIALRRRERYSFEELGRLTSIPSTTIRHWCAGETIGNRWDTLLRTNQRRRDTYKASETSILDSLNQVNQSTAKLFAALIYWCEGSKYPASSAVTFVNSDTDLVRTFLYFFRNGFSPNESKFRVHLQIHDHQNYSKLRHYWSELLNIPETQFIKPTVTHARGGKHRREYNGTCTLKYQDYVILLKLMGIYESFAKKSLGNRK